jgi:hypothetical protein
MSAAFRAVPRRTAGGQVFRNGIPDRNSEDLFVGVRLEGDQRRSASLLRKRRR